MDRKSVIAGALEGCSFKEWLEIRDIIDTQYKEASASVCLTDADVRRICEINVRDNLDRLVEAVGTAMSDSLAEALTSS